MKKKLFIVLTFMPVIVSCLSNKYECHIAIEDSAGIEKLHISGTLCDDTIFYFDDKSKDAINNTKGLEGGRVVLYNKIGIRLRQMPVIGPHESDISILFSLGIYCSPDGRLFCEQGYFVFPKKR
jgi:hypothetical protein